MRLRKNKIIGLLAAIFILGTLGFLIKNSLEVFFEYADGKSSANVVSSKFSASESAFQDSIDDSGFQLNATVASRISALRNDADDNAPLITNLTQNTAVEFLKFRREWIYVKTQTGMFGWMRRDALRIKNESSPENAAASDGDPHSLPKFPNGSFGRDAIKPHNF